MTIEELETYINEWIETLDDTYEYIAKSMIIDNTSCNNVETTLLDFIKQRSN